MNTVQLVLPTDLLEAAEIDPLDASRSTAMFLALELYRMERVSLGRAAELCGTPIEQFMVFAGQHKILIHYSSQDLEEDRHTLESLNL